MKTALLCFLLATTTVTGASADAVRTNVLVSGDPPLTITVRDGRVLTVLTFLSNGTGLASLAVTKDGKSTPILFPVDISNQGAIERELRVAGPATVTVNGSNQMLVVTYRLDPNQ